MQIFNQIKISLTGAKYFLTAIVLVSTCYNAMAADSSWSYLQQINDPATSPIVISEPASNVPSFFMDNDSNGYLIYQEMIAKTTEVGMGTRPNIGGMKIEDSAWSNQDFFTGETYLSSQTPNETQPTMDMMPDGRGAFISLYKKDGSITDYYYVDVQQLTGTFPGSRTTISKLTTEATYPSIAVATSDDTTIDYTTLYTAAVWSQKDTSGNWNVYLNFNAMGTAWRATPISIMSTTATYAPHAKIAIDYHGYATIAWTELDATSDGEIHLYAKRYDLNTASWLDDSAHDFGVFEDATTATESEPYFDLVVERFNGYTDNALLVWRNNQNPDDQTIMASSATSGTKEWSAGTTLSTSTGTTAYGTPHAFFGPKSSNNFFAVAVTNNSTEKIDLITGDVTYFVDDSETLTSLALGSEITEYDNTSIGGYNEHNNLFVFSSGTNDSGKSIVQSSVVDRSDKTDLSWTGHTFEFKDVEADNFYMTQGISAAEYVQPIAIAYSTTGYFAYATYGDHCQNGTMDSAIEECDDGNSSYFDGCDIDCKIESDEDGDGYWVSPNYSLSTLTDCDDTNPNINPGMTEVCFNEIDDDCNGTTDVGPAERYFFDEDGDGYGSLESELKDSCLPLGGYATNSRDCDDTNDLTYPGAAESCTDSEDNDCDRVINEGCAGEPTTDDDGDGFTESNGDCDDTNPLVYPSAPETCDSIDNNCSGGEDGESDASNIKTWYVDTDKDTYGNLETTKQSCSQPEGYVSDATDCKDTNDAIHPGATEIPDDGIDNDCIDGDASTTTTPVCGNKEIESGEECDGSSDCDDTCHLIPTTTPVCGNGTLETGETCDDNNTIDGDGCDSFCQTEVAPSTSGGGSGGGCSLNMY